MRRCLTIFLLSFSMVSHTQETVFTIKAGQRTGEVIPFNSIYKYQAFKPGTVLFVDGQTSVVFLNYNRVTGEIDFISPQFDTLAVANENSLKYIVIEKDTFYYDNGYVRLLASHNSKKLAIKEEFRMFAIDKLGAFDQPIKAAVDTYGALTTSRNVNLVVKEDIRVVLNATYYLGERQKFLPITRKNVMRTFPKQEKMIAAYLDSNNLDFNQEEDVKQLFTFLKSLE